MKKNVFFKGEITMESVKALSSDLDAAGPDAEVVIWFDSGGGHRDAAMAMSSIVEGFPGKLSIKVTWAASSCAFAFLLDTSRDFEFLPGSFSVVHHYSRETDTRALSDPAGVDAVLKKGTDQENADLLGMIRSHLTQAERTRFRRGHPVILVAERATKAIRVVRLAKGLGTPPERRRDKA